jgi:hypothetical protein
VITKKALPVITKKAIFTRVERGGSEKTPGSRYIFHDRSYIEAIHRSLGIFDPGRNRLRSRDSLSRQVISTSTVQSGSLVRVLAENIVKGEG